MRRLFTALLGILFLSLLVSTVSAGFIVWPNWDEAAKYPDPTGDATEPDPGLRPLEDMTICYVTYDSEYIYFRAEFAGGHMGDRVLLIYLDVDQNQATGDSGTDEDFPGYNLHDLGAEWRIVVNSLAEGLWKWDPGFNDWFPALSQNAWDQGDTYIMLRARLSDLENPQFPINILFISHVTVDTDWNPNAGHLEYPPTARPVGGFLVPTNKLTILAPYLALLGLFGAVTIAVAATRRRKP